MEQQLEYYVQQLKERNSEDAFFSLIHIDDSLIPQLIEAYNTETDLRVRSVLVEVIWQHRLPSSLHFLAEALREDSSDIWKTALDGIVTIGGPKGTEILQEERERLINIAADSPSLIARLEWIEEALAQNKEAWSDTK